MRKGWSALISAALVVACVGLAQTGTGHAALREAGLLQAPPGYTALAFSHPQSLPTQLRSEHASIDVSFGIHNASGTPRTYRWSIVLVRSGRTHLKAAGVLRMSAEGSSSIDRIVTTSCMGGRLQVVVRLATPTESIEFWTACRPQARGAR